MPRAIVLTLLCCASSLGQEAASPVPNRDALLNQMAEIVSPSIARWDTEHPIFHGCIDWHSAVHRHWALCRVARATGSRAERYLLAHRSTGR